MKKMLPEQTDNSDKAKNKLHVLIGSVSNTKTEKKMSTKISSNFMQNQMEKYWYANWYFSYGYNKRNWLTSSLCYY